MTRAIRYCQRRYLVGMPDATPFRFWTARGASRFLSKLHTAFIGSDARVRDGRAAPVFRRDARTGALEEIF